MKIAVFDNLANNAYSLTKIFRKYGYEADLLLDISDTYPMSQPIWDDCDFIISTDLLEDGKLTHVYWRGKCVGLKWERPRWIKETIRTAKIKSLFKLLRHTHDHLHLIKTAIEHRSLFPCSYEQITDAMKEYDVIIAFGLGPIYAFSADVPFIHYPYGGDLTLIPFQTNAIGSLQKGAVRHAKYIIVGDPGYLVYLKKLEIESKAVFLPFMIDPDVYKPIPKNGAADALGPDLIDRIQNKFTFFVPSRQDFCWKGSDKILIAFSKLIQQRSDIFMILSGWGKDLEKSKKMVDQLNLVDHTLFLPYIMSKKKLINFYSLVDVVIDQFNLGAYGTSTMEAMACGKPVIMNCDISRYAPYFKELPPILTARSVDEIYSQMLKVSENEYDICGQTGKKSREWIMEYHGTKNNFDKLMKLCQECLGQHK